ncbi:MAG: nucleoside hydrolase, partial [Youngiibacter sp.]|nr:nucleoside hydrolase [Youngiibacter sp.]
MLKKPIILDCDPGVDDAFAIMLANSYTGFDIRAITVVSGNVGIEHTSR